MMHQWPVRVPRPVAEKESSNEPFIVGQRVLDALSFLVCKAVLCAFLVRSDVVRRSSVRV